MMCVDQRRTEGSSIPRIYCEAKNPNHQTFYEMKQVHHQILKYVDLMSLMYYNMQRICIESENKSTLEAWLSSMKNSAKSGVRISHHIILYI